MGPIVQVGVSSEAVKQVGTELCQLIATLANSNCCDSVQKLAIRAFSKACSADNATIQNCTFNIGTSEPKPAKSSEGISPDGTSPGIAELLRRQQFTSVATPDHGTGNY